MRRLLFGLLSLTVCGLVIAAAVDPDEAYQLRREGKTLALEQVLQQANVRHPGTVIEVELEREHGRMVYEIELLDKAGVVWEMKYDAETGKIIEEEKDH